MDLGPPGVAATARPISLESAWIMALHRDRRGTLWVSIKEGLGPVAFDTRNRAAFGWPPPDCAEFLGTLPVDTIFDIWEDDLGILWLASWGAGLVRFDPQTEAFTASITTENGGSERHHREPHLAIFPDPTNKKVDVARDGQGGLFGLISPRTPARAIATRTRIRRASLQRRHRRLPRAQRDHLGRSVQRRPEPARSRRTGKAERFTSATAGPTPTSIILGIVADAGGQLWVTTNGGGLVHLDPKTKQLQVYDSIGRRAGQRVQPWRRSCAAKSGELFAGGAGGFNAFDPREIKRDPATSPPVVLTSFKIFDHGRQARSGRSGCCAARGLVPGLAFELQFAALAFAAPGKDRYAYKLEGFDDKFIETNRPFATYTKLGGGNCTLRIRASTATASGTRAGLALKLGVTPPIWRTWRAYGVYTILLAAAAYLVIQVRSGSACSAPSARAGSPSSSAISSSPARCRRASCPTATRSLTSRVQMFGVYRPADACGGDWWWHEPLSGGRHVVMVGDVTGHGPGPAMVTAAVATAFRVLHRGRPRRRRPEPRDAEPRGPAGSPRASTT